MNHHKLINHHHGYQKHDERLRAINCTPQASKRRKVDGDDDATREISGDNVKVKSESDEPTTVFNEVERGYTITIIGHKSKPPDGL